MKPCHKIQHHSILYVFAILCLLATLHVKAQRPGYWLGTQTGISHSELLRFTGKLDGATQYDGSACYIVGIDLIKILNEKFYLESGIRYSSQRFHYSYIDGMGALVESLFPEQVYVLSFPIAFGISIRKHLFLCCALLLDLDLSPNSKRTIDSQNGLGAALQFGFDIDLLHHIKIRTSSYFDIHSLLPLDPENYHQHLSSLGLKLDLMFGFN